MGRGNACTRGDYEGLYYIDYDNFSYEFEDDDGKKFIDYDLQRIYIDESLDMFKEDFKKRFNSFTECDEWLGREEYAILENELFYIVIEDNQWSVAVQLIQKEQGYYDDGNIENLQGKHYKTYLNGIKECLFNQFNELGTYGGPWTSGRITKE